MIVLASATAAPYQAVVRVCMHMGIASLVSIAVWPHTHLAALKLGVMCCWYTSCKHTLALIDMLREPFYDSSSMHVQTQ